MNCLEALKDHTVLERINKGVETNACVTPNADGTIFLKKTCLLLPSTVATPH